jgi:2-dehydro-3-deoxygluconokinase
MQSGASAATVVCIGEIMLRLSPPGRERLLQTPELRIGFGGAEANVAVSLAGFGHSARFVTLLPPGPLGDAVVGELRRCGVDVSEVQRAPGRLGLYFVTGGAIHRPPEVLYDRAGSAFALGADTLDLDAAFEGAAWLHLSGVTPAIGPAGARLAQHAVERAHDHGLKISFDGNFRRTLWEQWNAQPGMLLRDIAAHVHLLFGDERDIALMLGSDAARFAGADPLAAAARAAFEAFPQLERIACTQRRESSVDHHELSARLLARSGSGSGNGSDGVQARSYAVGPIVDRIGTGDAFAAGVLHGLLAGDNDSSALEFGLAAAVFKHSIPGDFNLASVAEVQAVIAAEGFGVRR